MCGIVGIAGWAAPSERRLTVERMLTRVGHRGPDAHETYASGEVCLGHARLSVIDLAGGGQPLVREDLAAAIVLNGEIYNYVEIRAELESKGHSFTTVSDTEVLLVAYREWGHECVLHFRGMFAFVIFDLANQTLFGARDRFGKKPLYLWHCADGLAFSSEMKALLEIADVERAVDVVAVAAYLEQLYVPEGRCIFRSVQKLPAGHAFTWRNGRLEIRQYWAPIFAERKPGAPEVTEAQLEDTIREAIRIRLRSDVPVGIFLSGGIDSSLVATLAADLVRQPLQTYTVNFEGMTDEAESAAAAQVARTIESDHTTITVPVPRPDRIISVLRHFDEPFADSSAVPMSLMSEVARQHVTVVLSGDGGDELFGGYSSYSGHARRLEHPEAAYGAHSSTTLRRLRALLPPGLERTVRRQIPDIAGLFRGRRTNAEEDILLGHIRGQVIHYEPPISKLMRADWTRAVGRGLEEQRALVTHAGQDLNRVFEYDIRHYLAGDILKKVDMTTMAFGLEARAPLLDAEVAAFAFAMPAHSKVDAERTKRPLKALLAKRLGQEFVERRKMGFGAPVAQWLQTPDMRQVVGDVLEGSLLRSGAWVQQGRVRSLVRRFYSGREYLAQQVWTLLALELWSRRYGVE